MPTSESAPKKVHWGREWIILIVLTVVGTFVLRTYVVQSYRIPVGVDGEDTARLHAGLQ